VEILVGIWLFSLLLISLSGIFLFNYAVSSFSTNYVNASYIAQNLMHKMKDKGYDSLEASLGSNTYTVNSESADYTIFNSITRKSDNPEDDNYDVLLLKVRVDWIDITRADFSDNKAVMRKASKPSTINLESLVTSVSQY
jgi:hypothetical protein